MTHRTDTTGEGPSARRERRGGGRRTAGAALLAAAMTAMFLPATASASASVSAGPVCYVRDGVRHTDVKGHTYTKDLYCENAVADVFATPEVYGTVIAKLKTSPSWFVCWESGDLHQGGNRIWYYTQGDEVTNWPLWKGWGYVPAFRIETEPDPFPGVPACMPS
ncbi:hypothetical protein [Streptomyces sp. NRRL S-920]|uniref:hypothetical protein n=1 Tax=Streptomyces sp. NRRL S-920 TaxID=1463921 RepID=UPI00131DF54A|nr:hypothetical protein [Streptomyces sp. NRRL S-920]